VCGKGAAIHTSKFFNSKTCINALRPWGWVPLTGHSILQPLPILLRIGRPCSTIIFSATSPLPSPRARTTTTVVNSAGRHNVYDIRRLHRRWNRSLWSSNGHSRLRNGENKVCIIIAKSRTLHTHIHTYTGFGLGEKGWGGGEGNELRLQRVLWRRPDSNSKASFQQSRKRNESTQVYFRVFE